MTHTRAAKTRVLIADDEPLARERLRMLLAQEEWVEIAGECQNGQEAVAAIHKLHPDLVFLDIQMPGATAFEVIQQVGVPRMPPVVFVTAYDKYALRAFDVHALDYLLKPFDGPRFLRTLQRARERLERQRAGDLGKRLLAMVQDLKPEAAQPPDRIVVKSGGRIFFIRTDEIDWVDAAGNYVRLHVKGESYLFRETMSAMEARLDADRFVRIHRSHIVNADRIKELQPGAGDHAVILRSGVKLPLSRGYKDRLQEKLGRTT
jgi:two-component system LytT family response regulator